MLMRWLSVMFKTKNTLYLTSKKRVVKSYKFSLPTNNDFDELVIPFQL